MARFVWKYVWVSGAGAHEKMSVKRVRWLQDTKGISGSTTAAMKWILLGEIPPPARQYVTSKRVRMWLGYDQIVEMHERLQSGNVNTRHCQHRDAQKTSKMTG